jgi:hypothetical protein
MIMMTSRSEPRTEPPDSNGWWLMEDSVTGYREWILHDDGDPYTEMMKNIYRSESTMKGLMWRGPFEKPENDDYVETCARMDRKDWKDQMIQDQGLDDEET